MADRYTLKDTSRSYDGCYMEMVIDNPTGEWDIEYSGEWVKWEDYKKLEEENKKLKEEVEQLKDDMECFACNTGY